MVIHIQVNIDPLAQKLLYHISNRGQFLIFGGNDLIPLFAGFLLDSLPVRPMETNRHHLLLEDEGAPLFIEVGDGRHPISLEENRTQPIPVQKLEVGFVQVIGIPDLHCILAGGGKLLDKRFEELLKVAL